MSVYEPDLDELNNARVVCELLVKYDRDVSDRERSVLAEAAAILRSLEYRPLEAKKAAGDAT